MLFCFVNKKGGTGNAKGTMGNICFIYGIPAFKHFQNRFWREKKLDFTQAIIHKPYIHIDNFVKDAWLPFDPRVLNFEDPKGKKTWAL